MKKIGTGKIDSPQGVLLVTAGIEDIPKLIEIEKSIPVTQVYSPATTEEDWKEIFATSEVYFIKEGENFVGNISFEEKSVDHIHISGFAIAKEFQGRGIARKTIEEVLEMFGDVQKIDLVTHPGNEKAIELYKSFGFSLGEEIPNYYGDGESRVIMVKSSKV